MRRYTVSRINAPHYRSNTISLFELLYVSEYTLLSLTFPTPSSVIMSNGCAQDENGNLLSPSKIQFFFDADDEVPLPSLPPSLPPAPLATTKTLSNKPVPTTSPPAASSSSCPSKFKPTSITRFFAADTAAGIRRSGRATRPSTKVTDPDNLESNNFFAPSGTKRKADSAGDEHWQQPQRLRKAASDGNKDAGEPSEGDAGHTGDATETSDFEPLDVVELTDRATSDDDEEDVEARYASTKALGDADRKVSVSVHLQFTQC
jgi:hypothetical protein